MNVQTNSKKNKMKNYITHHLCYNPIS